MHILAFCVHTHLRPQFDKFFFTEKFDINYYSPEALILAQNAPQTVWRPGSARTRWGSLLRSPRPSSWIKGVGPRGGEGKWDGKREKGGT